MKKNTEMKEEKPKTKKIMSDHIEEYFAKVEGTKEAYHSRELFQANENVDLKTDLTSEEISFINILQYNDELLMKRGLKPIFKSFLNSYMRLKFSLDRKSRGEFVSINKNDDIEKASTLANNLSGITGSKK